MLEAGFLQCSGFVADAYLGVVGLSFSHVDGGCRVESIAVVGKMGVVALQVGVFEDAVVVEIVRGVDLARGIF